MAKRMRESSQEPASASERNAKEVEENMKAAADFAAAESDSNSTEEGTANSTKEGTATTAKDGDSIEFTDKEGDIVSLRREDGQINEYCHKHATGKEELDVKGITALIIDMEKRTFSDSGGSGDFSDEEDLEDLEERLHAFGITTAEASKDEGEFPNWQTIDFNHNKKLSFEEFERGMVACYSGDLSMDALFEHFDINENREISKEEYEAGVKEIEAQTAHGAGSDSGISDSNETTVSDEEHNHPDSPDFPTFEVMDIDGKGSISRDELERGLQAMYSGSMDPDELFQRFNLNGNTSISKAEYDIGVKDLVAGGDVGERASEPNAQHPEAEEYMAKQRDEVVGQPSPVENKTTKVEDETTPTRLQRTVCSIFHQHKLAWGQPVPTWDETRPPGEQPFHGALDKPWKLQMLCPTMKDKSTLDASIRDEYAVTKDDTMIVQITTGKDVVTSWFLNIHDLDVRNGKTETDRDLKLTLTAKLGSAVGPDEAFPKMGYNYKLGKWKGQLADQFKEADCELHSKFYKMPTPQKEDGMTLPLMTQGRLRPELGDKRKPGRFDLVNTVQCCPTKCDGNSTRSIYKIFL